jgi:hypothetical protein
MDAIKACQGGNVDKSISTSFFGGIFKLYILKNKLAQELISFL